MAHSFTNLLYHIVFSTKNREPWLEKPKRTDLFEYMGGLIRERGGIPLIINGIEDHAHLLAKLRQDRSISDVVWDIKALSSLWIHKKYAELECFAWQTGYGAFTVSQSQEQRVRRYIANQEEHHKAKPFQDEYRQLHRKHGIEWSEEDVWD